MKYFEVTFSIEPDNELAHDLLPSLAGEIGFESFTDEDGCLKGYIQQDFWNEEALNEIIENIPLPGTTITFTCEEAEYRDWNEEWEKQNFNRVEIGENLCLIHSSEIEDDDSFCYNISLNPKMAFGTGTHETTSMLVEYIASLDMRNKNAFDMGCGTSILSIMACLRGADKVQAVDIDEWSVENSREKISINGFDKHIEVFLGDASILPINEQKADLFMANINRNILLNDMDKYAKCIASDGTLLISGFYTEDAAVLIEKAASLGFAQTSRNERNNWCMLAFEKKQ